MDSYAPPADSTAASVDISTASTSLPTDMYKFAMLQGALASGITSRRSILEFFGRRLPGPRRFGVATGTGRLLDAIKTFIFTPAQISFLRRAGVVNDEILDFLCDYHFSGAIHGYIEGKCYFTGSPLLIVEDTSAETCTLETLVLSTYNYDCVVVTTASRMTIVAYGCPCAGFGTRRVHGQVTVVTTRISVVGGFVGASSLEAGLLYGIPTVRTSAHFFTFLHDTEERAFAAQVINLGSGTTVLVDTYDVAAGTERMVRATRAAGDELGVVHLDSGDLAAKAFKVRAQLDALGAISVRITITSDLDEHVIAVLGTAPADSYDVGTRLITGLGHPTAALAYKLVKHESADNTMKEIAKFSSGGKSVVDGRRWADCILSFEGTAAEGLVVASSLQDEGMSALSQTGARPLQVLLVDEGWIIGEHRGKEASSVAAKRYRASCAELPYNAWRLSGGESALLIRHVDLNERGATRR